MKLVVRKAGPNDAAAIARVNLETWRQAYRGILPQGWLDGRSLEKKTQQQREQLGLRDQVRFVADQDGKVVAYAAVGPNRVPVKGYPAEVYGLYVLPDFQRQGIGKTLVKRGREWLKLRVPGAVIVWVLEKNPCRSFYVETGATLLELARRRSYGGSVFKEVAYAWEDLA